MGDGSAFSLYGRPSWDPSIPKSKVQMLDAENTGEVRSGNQLSPMDAFYDHQTAADAAPGQLWQLAPELHQLLGSRIKVKPAMRQPCGILPGVISAHSGYGWLTESQ